MATQSTWGVLLSSQWCRLSKKVNRQNFFRNFQEQTCFVCCECFFTWNLKKFIASELIFEKSEDNPLVFVPKTNWQKWPGKSPSWFWWCQRYSHQVWSGFFYNTTWKTERPKTEIMSIKWKVQNYWTAPSNYCGGYCGVVVLLCL